MTESSATATQGTAWLRATGIDKDYDSRHRHVEVLRGADLEVRAGESVAIMGVSGSGKSTLLNLLGSLDHPDAGSILWGETRAGDLVGEAREVWTRTAIATGIGLLAAGLTFAVGTFVFGVGFVDPVLWALVVIIGVGAAVATGVALPAPSEARRSALRNREIGFVFQQHHLLGDFTAIENVTMPARVQGLPAKEAEERARNLLSRVGLASRLDHLPGEMSGGEQQRVAIARALMNRPRLLLLDEPGGNLDRRRSDDLHELLIRLAREDDVAVVAVTHDESLARRADRWLRLEGGHLVPVDDLSTEDDA